MNIKIFATFPNIINASINESILFKAKEKNIYSIKIIDIKEYRTSKRNIDDTCYGGGSGMIMRPDVISDALEANINFKTFNKETDLMLLTSPRGISFSQNIAHEYAKNIKNLYIVTNRYEGIDQRVIDYYDMTEISIGNYIIMGGELAACIILEAVIRLIPNALSNPNSITNETFSKEGLIKYDQYTKPCVWKGKKVPEILLSGNHGEIAKFRLKNSDQKLL